MKRLLVFTTTALALTAIAFGLMAPAPAVAAAPTAGLSCKFWHNANNNDTTQYFGENTNSATWGDADNVNFADSSTPTGDCSTYSSDIGNQWSLSQYYNSNNSDKGGKVNDVATLNYYTVLFQGYLKPNITTSTLWLRVVSDDASYLWTGNNAVSGWTRTNATAKHPGLHGTGVGVITPGSISVTSGHYYPIRILFGEYAGGDEFTLTYNTDGGSTWSPVPTSWVYNQGTTVNNDQTAPTTPSAPSLTAATDTGASSSDGITSNTAPVLAGTVEANATVSVYSNASNSNTGGTLLGTATADGSGAYSYTLSLTSSTDKYFYVTATDVFNNVSAASPTARIRANTITITRGAAGAQSGVALVTQPIVTLTDGGSPSVAVTNSLGSVANGSVNAVSGTATFAGVAVTYASGSLAGSTNTYAADGYFSATETLSAIPAGITVATGTTTAGTAFLNNTLYSLASGTVTLTPTDLLTQMSTASGATNLYAMGAITVSNPVTSTYAGKALKFATTDSVALNAALITLNGSVTVLSNADGGSGANAGNIVVGSSGGITTAGGPVILAGGDWTATTGYARGTATTTSAGNAGVLIQGTISTGGGAFTANGLLGTAATDSAGFYLGAGGKIQAAGGDVNISGLIDATSSSTGGAFRGVRLGAGGGTPYAEVTTTGAGVINITGKTSKASSIEQAVLFEYATVTAVNGVVTVTADAYTAAANGLVFTTGDSTVTTTGTGNVVIRSPQWTSGGDVYTNAIFNSGGNLNVTSPGITISKNWTCAGVLYVNAHGGELTINANITVSGAGNAATLKTAGSVVLGAYTVQTNNGPLWLWSDIDGNGGGVKTAAGSTISTGGAAVMISGGTNTIGSLTSTWAKGSSLTDDFGVSLGGTLNAGGGNITIRGEEAAAVNSAIFTDRAGVVFNKTSSTTTSGSGTIIVDGKVDGALADNVKFHHGVVVGGGDAANLATIAGATGAISIKGDASGNTGSYRRGVLMNRASITTTTGPITVEGLGGSGSGSLSAQFYGDNNTMSSTSGAILIKGRAGTNSYFYSGSASSGGGVTLQLSTLVVNNGSTFTLGGASAKVIESTSSESAFSAATTFTGFAVSTDSTSLRVGKTTNNSAVTFGTGWSVAGPISIYGSDVTTSGNLAATGPSGSIAINSNGLFSNSATISSAAGNQPTVIKAQKAALSGSISSGTAATQVTGFGSGRTIDLGLTGDSTDTLAISNTELATITAGSIRVGDATSGDITVSSAVNIDSAKSANLALRTAGNVAAINSASITATNLGIAAGGTISLGGANSIGGNLAIVASGASGGSGVTVTGLSVLNPVSVDAIEPVYGLGKNISVTNAPAIGSTEIRYLNQTWSAPPVVTVKDAYGYTISTINSTRNSYVTTLTDSGAPVLAGTTPVISGGTQTFSNLKFITTEGSTSLTFSTAGLVAGGISSITTGSYTVRGTEPDSIALSTAATSAAAGQTGFGIIATLNDSSGNPVLGNHATDAISVAVTDGDSDATNNATLVSGYTPTTVAGAADFSALVLGGKVGITYTLTFTVSYTDFNSTTQTRTATQQVSLTPGAATHLAIQTAANGFVNRANFTTQPAIAVKDAYENTVTGSTVSIDATETGFTLTGPKSVAAFAGVATFAGLGKSGTVGSGKRITYSASGLGSVYQEFALTHGSAHHLTLVASSSATDNTIFASQPLVTILDQDENVVTTGLQSTQTVTLSVSGATTVALGGSVSFDAVDGVADFAGLGVKLVGTAGNKLLSASISNPTTLTATVAIDLLAVPTVIVQPTPAPVAPPTPTILGSSRKTAITSGGQALTLQTRNFSGVTAVLLEGKALTIIAITDDEITVALPEHAPGPVDIIFKAASGSLVYQDAVIFVAAQKATVTQTQISFASNGVVISSRIAATIRAVTSGPDAPQSMNCVGLVPIKHGLNDVKLARARAAAVCAIGAKSNAKLQVKTSTATTKKSGAASRSVIIGYRY